MRQRWQIINLDRMETTGHLSESGRNSEAFYNIVKSVLEQIMVPPKSIFDPKLPRFGNVCRKGRAVDVPGRWAGARLICLGDYAKDLPAGLLTREDISSLEPSQSSDSGTGYAQADTLRRLFNENEAPHLYGWRMVDYGLKDSDVWVLRNLTKKVYVRSDGIPTTSEFAPGTLRWNYHQGNGYDRVPGLTQALLLHTRWSTDDSTAMHDRLNDKYQLTRGTWAGDRFDMRVHEDVVEDMIVEGWVDVTRNVARAIVEIWETDMRVDYGGYREEPEKEY